MSRQLVNKIFTNSPSRKKRQWVSESMRTSGTFGNAQASHRSDQELQGHNASSPPRCSDDRPSAWRQDFINQGITTALLDFLLTPD